MDRPLKQETITKNRRKVIFRAAAIIAGILLLFFLFSAWLSPSINRSEILTANVVRGTIEGTITASGTVVPMFEQAISCAGETRILKILKKPGSAVKQGESLLELDKSEVLLLLERTQKELTLKENSRTQLKLDLEKTLSDLKSQLTIKELRLKYLQSKTVQGEKMFSLGAMSKDQYEQVKLEEQIAEIERSDLEESIANTKLSLENRLDGITTEVGTLFKEKADISRQLDLLSCKAEHDGVVTWLNESLGSAVHRGDIIARVADLSAYRVEGTVSDIHASRLQAGMPATVRLNERNYRAQVQTVYPTIENGIVKVSLALNDSTATTLRPNLRVDIYLITRSKENALKIKRGPFIKGQQQQPVFIIRDDVARRVQASIGIMSVDEVEILSGVSEGDEMIVSDIKEFEHLTQMKVR